MKLLWKRTVLCHVETSCLWFEGFQISQVKFIYKADEKQKKWTQTAVQERQKILNNKTAVNMK